MRGRLLRRGQGPGYQPGVYASTTWFRKRLDMSRLTQYNIWNAHYNVASSPIACNMWQGSCTARIPGYGGQIDVNISYMAECRRHKRPSRKFSGGSFCFW